MKKNKPPVEKKHFLQILSVFAAIVLWFAITYSEDPTISLTINNIPIKTIGERNLSKNDLVFVDRDKLPSLSIDVRGRRSDVQSILNSVSATLDLSDINQSGEFSKELSYDIPNQSVMIAKNKYPYVTVLIENAMSKEVPVYISQIGADKNKEYLVKSTPLDKYVKIVGTKDDLAKIKEVLISIDTSTTSLDFNNNYTFSYADETHNVYTPKNNVIPDTSYVEVQNTVYIRKEVPVVLNPEVNFAGYQFIVKSFSKDKVDVGILPDLSNEISVIYADFLGEIAHNTSGKYNMRLIVPDGIYCPSQEKELIMNADIEKIVTLNVPLTVTAQNIPSGLKASILPSTITASLTGAESKMKDVSAKVDLTNLLKGSHTLPVIFETNNTGVLVNSSHSVYVTIS